MIIIKHLYWNFHLIQDEINTHLKLVLLNCRHFLIHSQTNPVNYFKCLVVNQKKKNKLKTKIREQNISHNKCYSHESLLTLPAQILIMDTIYLFHHVPVLLQ